MTRPRRWAVAVLALVAVERALHVLMSRFDVVHVLLSPGSHSGLLALLLAATFLVLRIAVWVGLPAVGAGWLAHELARWVARRIGARQAASLSYASRAGSTSGPEEACPSDTT